MGLDPSSCASARTPAAETMNPAIITAAGLFEIPIFSFLVCYGRLGDPHHKLSSPKRFARETRIGAAPRPMKRVYCTGPFGSLRMKTSGVRPGFGWSRLRSSDMSSSVGESCATDSTRRAPRKPASLAVKNDRRGRNGQVGRGLHGFITLREAYQQRRARHQLVTPSRRHARADRRIGALSR